MDNIGSAPFALCPSMTLKRPVLHSASRQPDIGPASCIGTVRLRPIPCRRPRWFLHNGRGPCTSCLAAHLLSTCPTDKLLCPPAGSVPRITFAAGQCSKFDTPAPSPLHTGLPDWLLPSKRSCI